MERLPFSARLGFDERPAPPGNSHLFIQ